MCLHLHTNSHAFGPSSSQHSNCTGLLRFYTERPNNHYSVDLESVTWGLVFWGAIMRALSLAGLSHVDRIYSTVPSLGTVRFYLNTTPRE